MSVPRRRGLLVDDPLASGEYRNQAACVTSGSEVASRLRDIPIGEIRSNPDQPRKRFEDEALEALADSIRGRGVLQPVIVRPVDGRFELVVGERRWRAAKLAGETTIPALVDDELDPAGSLELALIENIVRENISPIEQARAFSVLLDDQRMTLTVLSRRIGRSRPDIANTVRLLDLPDAVIELIDSGALTKGHGKVLLSESDHHRRLVLARQAVEQDARPAFVSARARGASAGVVTPFVRKQQCARARAAAVGAPPVLDKMGHVVADEPGGQRRRPPAGTGTPEAVAEAWLLFRSFDRWPSDDAAWRSGACNCWLAG